MALGKITLRKSALLFLLVSVSCATGHCRKPMTSPVPAVDEKSAEASEHVFVHKPDGSRMCKQGRAIPLSEMKADLKDIKIFSEQKKRDGLMHVQVCGSPTGVSNVFEILVKDLPAAEKLGYKKWLY
jgi:hypothetical protein